MYLENVILIFFLIFYFEIFIWLFHFFLQILVYNNNIVKDSLFWEWSETQQAVKYC